MSEIFRVVFSTDYIKGLSKKEEKRYLCSGVAIGNKAFLFIDNIAKTYVKPFKNIERIIAEINETTVHELIHALNPKIKELKVLFISWTMISSDSFCVYNKNGIWVGN